MAVGYYSKNYYIFLCEFFVRLFLASEFFGMEMEEDKNGLFVVHVYILVLINRMLWNQSFQSNQEEQTKFRRKPIQITVNFWKSLSCHFGWQHHSLVLCCPRPCGSRVYCFNPCCYASISQYSNGVRQVKELQTTDSKMYQILSSCL